MLALCGCTPTGKGYVASDVTGAWYYVRPMHTEPGRGWYAVDVSCYRVGGRAWVDVQDGHSSRGEW